ncbi:hypothetical protein BV511_03235 [Methylorubrum extorquens]|nr:hypothetical protein BV511_03235 [Methylorubrum extorquens]
MGSWLRNGLCRLICPHCGRSEHDRLDRAEKLHEMSVRAVQTAQRKQARRLSDVRVVVEATIQQMDERAHRAEERAR